MTLDYVHHVVLYCVDTEASRVWYEQVGFEYLRGYGGMHWFALGPTELMLHPAEHGPDRYAPTLHAATSDVDALFLHVVNQGLTPLDHQGDGSTLTGPVTRPWGDREFELDDLDGHHWAFTQV